MFFGSGACNDIIPEPARTGPEPARNRPGTGLPAIPRTGGRRGSGGQPVQRRGHAAAGCPAGPCYEASAGLRADLFARALHPARLRHPGGQGLRPDMRLRRGEALRSLMGPPRARARFGAPEGKAGLSALRPARVRVRRDLQRTAPRSNACANRIDSLREGQIP